jgi:hypothetical protein
MYLIGYKLDFTGIDPGQYKEISSFPEGSGCFGVQVGS